MSEKAKKSSFEAFLRDLKHFKPKKSVGYLRAHNWGTFFLSYYLRLAF